MLKWPLTINQTAERDRKKSWLEQKRQKGKHDVICTLNTISQKMADFCCVSFDVWRCKCGWSDQQNGTLIGIKAKLFPGCRRVCQKRTLCRVRRVRRVSNSQADVRLCFPDDFHVFNPVTCPPTLSHAVDFSSYFVAASSFHTTSGSQTRQWHRALIHSLSRSGWNLQTGCQWFYLSIYLFLFGLKEMCTFHFIRRLGGQSNVAQDEPEGRPIIDPSPPLSQCQKHIQG